MRSSTTTVADRLVEAMRDADWQAVVSTYAPDVLLDMNLPTWRFQLQGRAAAAQFFLEQTTGLENLHTTQHRVIDSSDRLLVIEEEMRFDGDGGEYLWRAIDVFRFDGDAVVEHIEYCSGCWPPDQVARHAAEAPMVRW